MKGSTYTLSGYINTGDIGTFASGSGVYLAFLTSAQVSDAAQLKNVTAKSEIIDYNISLGGATRLNKVTVGRGNMAAVYRGGLSKIRNKNASKMSVKVLWKGIKSTFAGSFLKSVSSGIKQHFLRW